MANVSNLQPNFSIFGCKLERELEKFGCNLDMGCVKGMRVHFFSFNCLLDQSIKTLAIEFL
jgi:hypothetical protein